MPTVDRRPYLSATVLDQALLDEMAGNLEFGLEMAATVGTPTGLIYVSDRNKYVGSTFYQALCTFPVVTRTLGDWLSPEVEFSHLELVLSNVDGRFNSLLSGGADFGGWIAKPVVVSLGLRDVGATFSPIYNGRVTEIGGLQRDRQRIRVLCRDEFDFSNVNFPKTTLGLTAFPDLEDGLVGTVLPVIYGDYTTVVTRIADPIIPGQTIDTASVPAYPLNGAAAATLAGTQNLQLLTSENDNLLLDATEVWVKRGDAWGKFVAADVTGVTGNRYFELKQTGTGGVSSVGGVGFVYNAGDQIFVRVKGKDLGAYQDNLVAQAMDILETQAGLVSGDFDATWAKYRDKTVASGAPAESATGDFKGRVYLQEPEGVVRYVKSMLTQVRLEPGISRELKWKLVALHLDEFEATPAFHVRQWDVQQEGGLQPKLDDKNVWNRAQADYAFDPASKENIRQTGVYRNSAAITQVGKAISKKVVFPNLYVAADVVANLREMIRLASGYAEFIEMTLTPRATLLDLGDFVSLDIEAGSTVFAGAPALVRSVGRDPNGLRTLVKVWSFQMVPFPGWSPGYAGIVGGSAATITLET